MIPISAQYSYSTILTGAGAYAGCSYCCLKGEYSTILSKMIYLDHRSFLPAIDKLRLDKKSFASPMDVPKSPPTIKTMSYVDTMIGKLTAASSNDERKQIVRQKRCRTCGKTSLWRNRYS